MEAFGAVAKSQEIEFKALEGSLSMMSKVLNDVLDFNRMDSGRFESVLKVGYLEGIIVIGLIAIPFHFSCSRTLSTRSCVHYLFHCGWQRMQEASNSLRTLTRP